MSFQTTCIFAKFTPHVFQLLQHDAGVVSQRSAGWGWLDAPRSSFEQGGTKRVFHASDSLARGSQRHIGLLGPERNAGCLDHLEEKAEISQIETHDIPIVAGEPASAQPKGG
jgi:hypothetical protein